MEFLIRDLAGEKPIALLQERPEQLRSSLDMRNIFVWKCKAIGLMLIARKRVSVGYLLTGKLIEESFPWYIFLTYLARHCCKRKIAAVITAKYGNIALCTEIIPFLLFINNIKTYSLPCSLNIFM